MTRARDYVLEPRPRPLTRRGGLLLGTVVLGGVALLILLLQFYDSEGGTRVEGGLADTESAGLVVTLQPRTVAPRLGDASFRLLLDWQAPAEGEDDTMLADTRITVFTTLGAQQFVLPAAETYASIDVTLAVSGEEAQYPFDSHQGVLAVSAESLVVGEDGRSVAGGSVPVGLRAEGAVSGWSTGMTLPTSFAPDQVAFFTFTRAFSTQVFAVLLITLSVIIAMCAIVVAVLVASNRRRVEATMLSWMAALLFALPMLRNFLPNSPPIGAAMDIYVFLWVIVTAVAALVLFVYGWISQNRAILVARRALANQGSDYAA